MRLGFCSLLFALLMGNFSAIGQNSDQGQSPAKPVEAAQVSTKGLQWINDKNSGNCAACHAMPGVAGVQSTFAPPLHEAGQKWTPAELTQWVTDARQMYPNTLMPSFGSAKEWQKANSSIPILTTEQIKSVVDTLTTWRAPSSISNRPPTKPINPSNKPLQHLSGTAFLSPELLELQNDLSSNPIGLWTEQGRALWNKRTSGSSCAQCHGNVAKMRGAALGFPRWSASKQKLVNLEDQILTCAERTGAALKGLEDPDVLSLSALLHSVSQGMEINMTTDATTQSLWQNQLRAGEKLFNTRIGRMNLACSHCHDQKIGLQMRAEVISPGHPTGFPIFKMSWQAMGSVDRRLRACFSGVQAELPEPGSAVLRQLELYMKMRANGMLVEGPLLRR